MKKPSSPKFGLRSTSQQFVGKKKPNESSTKFQKKVNSKCIHGPKSESSIQNRKTPGKKEPPVSTRSLEGQLIPTPKTPKHPKETLQRSLTKLKSSQWNEYVPVLRDILQISRFTPQLLEKSMPIVFKGVTKLLRNSGIRAARTACQATNELFMNVSTNQTPELEELVLVLLQKTSASNTSLQKDALEALNSMVIHAPPAQTIKILLQRQIAGCDANVRATASKLLACVLDRTDSYPAFSLSEDLKTRLVYAAMRFLQDDCHDLRVHGTRIMTMLLENKDFDDVFQKKVSPDTLKKVGKFVDNAKVTLRQGDLGLNKNGRALCT